MAKQKVYVRVLEQPELGVLSARIHYLREVDPLGVDLTWPALLLVRYPDRSVNMHRKDDVQLVDAITHLASRV